MIKDPVCGMVVDPAKSVTTADYEGKTYYFCTPGCQTAFEEVPEKFIEPAGTAGEGTKQPSQEENDDNGENS